MSDQVTIALDAMGGDRAPDMVLKGASIALQRFPQARFLVYGIEGRGWFLGIRAGARPKT